MPRLSLSSRLCLSMVLALTSACTAPVVQAISLRGPHHPHRMAKQQVEELERQWRAAALIGDLTTMDGLLSEDYVGISWNGQVNTKATQLDRVRSHEFALTVLDLLDSKVKVVGNVAIVTSLAKLEGTNEGVSFTGMFRYTRVYQRLANGDWKITNFEATRVPDKLPPHSGAGPQG